MCAQAFTFILDLYLLRFFLRFFLFGFFFAEFVAFPFEFVEHKVSVATLQLLRLAKDFVVFVGLFKGSKKISKNSFEKSLG